MVRVKSLLRLSLLTLAGLVCLLAAALFGYRRAAHVYLNSQSFHALVNPPGTKVLITWSDAVSPWPGLLEVKDLAVAGQHGKRRSVRWRVEAVAAEGHVDLLALLHRTFRFTSLVGDGTRVLLRTGRTPLPELPLVALPPEETPRKKAGGWTIRLDQTELRRLTDVWIDELRFQGEATAGLGLVVGGGHLAFPHFAARFGKGRLALGKVGPVELRTLAFDGVIREFTPRKVTGRGFARAVTARLRADASVQSVALLNTYLSATRWLTLRRGAGRLTADVRYERGRLVPGTRVVVRSEALEAAAWGQLVRGAGRVTLRVDGPRAASRLAVSLRLPHYELGPDEPREAAPVVGRDLRLDVSGPNPRLGEPLARWECRLVLPAADVRDLAYVNDFLPEGAPLRILGGRGGLVARLSARGPTGAGSSGTLALAAKDATFTLAGAITAQGNIDMALLLDAVDAAHGAFDLKGSRVTLSDVTTVVGKERQTGWWAHLQIPRGLVRVAKPRAFDGTVEASLRDLSPLVAFVKERRGLAGRLAGALKLTDVQATASLFADEHRFRLTDATATDASGVRVDGWYERIGHDGKGRLLAQDGLLKLGLAFEGGKVDWKVLGARKWFERQQAPSH